MAELLIPERLDGPHRPQVRLRTNLQGLLGGSGFVVEVFRVQGSEFRFQVSGTLTASRAHG